MSDWRQLPTLWPRAALHHSVVARVDEQEQTSASDRWAVAVSGGADSVALLLAVWQLWPSKRARLVVLHFNHRLRGAESDGDEAFCRQLSAELGVEFRCGRWAESFAGASEAAAREARMAFFAAEMTSLGTAILWTGHQKDDIAETMLMRIARGSSASGLAAPRPVQVMNDGRVFLRPLLTIAKADIVHALTAAGVSWREDASNGTGEFFRNRVRHSVVPVWRAAAENDAPGGAALTRELLAEEDDALEAWLAERMPASAYGSNTLDLRGLARSPRALWRRALRRWPPLAALARAGFEEVLAICERGAGRASAGDGVVEMSEGTLYFSHREPSEATALGWEPVSLVPGTTLFLPSGAQLTTRVVVFTPELREQIYGGAIDPTREAYIANATGGLSVRSSRLGDRYRPLGAPGSAKLQDLFVNRKIPAALRRTLPVICDATGTILWVPGCPSSDDSKVTNSSVTGVRLTYESGTYTVRLQSQRVNV
jgi:tRNA(Ile)-lysidine synthase